MDFDYSEGHLHLIAENPAEAYHLTQLCHQIELHGYISRVDVGETDLTFRIPLQAKGTGENVAMVLETLDKTSGKAAPHVWSSYSPENPRYKPEGQERHLVSPNGPPGPIPAPPPGLTRFAPVRVDGRDVHMRPGDYSGADLRLAFDLGEAQSVKQLIDGKLIPIDGAGMLTRIRGGEVFVTDRPFGDDAWRHANPDWEANQKW
jgi:hypothetical protein